MRCCWLTLSKCGSPSSRVGLFSSFTVVRSVCENERRDSLALRETFSVRRAEGRGESKSCFIRHWGASMWLNLGQNWTITVFLAGSVRAVLLPRKTKQMQELNNPDVGSLPWPPAVWCMSSGVAELCPIPGGRLVPSTVAGRGTRCVGAGKGPNQHLAAPYCQDTAVYVRGREALK